MRRLWAHILIAFTALVAVFASMPSLIRGINSNSNGDHVRRREFTFQLTERKEKEGEAKPKKLSNNSAKEMASVVEQRLINSGIDSYSITTSGNSEIDDIVTVSFKADDDSQYTQIVNYLTFSGSFALMNNQDQVVTASEFRDGDPYLKNHNVNEYPTVILPIKTDYNKWEVLVKNAIDNPITEEAESEESEPTKYARIWLIKDYEDGDTYSSLTDSKKLSDKTLYYFDFDPKNPDELYYDSNKNSLARVCGYQDTNGNGMADPSEVRAAFNTADYYLNLFNASALDYKVECIRGLGDYKVWVEAPSEVIIKNDKINWNPTLSASVAAFAILTLLMVVFYRLGAISGVVTTMVSVGLSIFFVVQTALSYNILALAGIVVVAATSLLSSIVYLNKLKEDAYRGHTLKKANTEASKKSLLPIVDINVVTIVIGLMSYLLGGSALHSFGSILLFGGFISLLLNTLALKGLMWLITNATALSGKYELFGINPENVPNHMAEEKQRFFGAYADRDLSVKKKPVGIASICGFVVALAGCIVAASLGGGQLIKSPSSVVTKNEIYLVNKVTSDKEDTKMDENKLKTYFLDTIEVKVEDEYKDLSEFIASEDYVHYEVTSSETVEETTVNYITTYYVLSTKKTLTLDSLVREKGSTDEPKSLADYLTMYNTDSTYGIKASFKVTSTHVNLPNTDVAKVSLASSIAILILTVYFMLRYRLSRGLASILFPIISGTVTFGILALVSVLGVTLPATVYIALPIVIFLTYIFMIHIMNKDREMVLDDKVRDTSVEHREEIAKKANSIALTPVLASAVIGIYLLINFFGFGTAIASYTYLAAILGSIVALGIVVVLFTPVSSKLYKLFSNVHFEFKPRKQKNKATVTKKSAEPEEAIFIGIND